MPGQPIQQSEKMKYAAEWGQKNENDSSLTPESRATSSRAQSVVTY